MCIRDSTGARLYFVWVHRSQCSISGNMAALHWMMRRSITPWAQRPGMMTGPNTPWAQSPFIASAHPSVIIWTPSLMFACALPPSPCSSPAMVPSRILAVVLWLIGALLQRLPPLFRGPTPPDLLTGTKTGGTTLKNGSWITDSNCFQH